MTALPPSIPPPRRHDLDALRAVAMLLGIALHGALSFVKFPWLVQDSRQHEVFGWFFYATHGFRMPLFFVMSGFFTAMLWRKRGLGALLKHRVLRIFCPLCLGMVTIIPVLNLVYGMAMKSNAEHWARQAQETTQTGNALWVAAREGDLPALRSLAASGTDINALDETFGVTPLVWAVLKGRTEAARELVALGADPNVRQRDGTTALHAAAVFGRVELVRLLIENGADVNAVSHDGSRPLDSTQVDLGTAHFIAALFEVELDEQVLQNGWSTSAALLQDQGAIGRESSRSEPDLDEEKAEALWEFLFGWPVFHHLWFLWHLCWLVAGFALVALLAGALRIPALPAWLLTTPAVFLWLIPLTMVAQAPMDSFGPDTSIGILPMPHVLGYYTIFFGFGSLYYLCDDPEGQISRGWWGMLTLALLLVFPLGLLASFGTIAMPASLAVFLQAAYPWLMTFGLMGLFRMLLSEEHRVVRYVSDSSYWLYLVHLPLVIAAQLLVRDWPAPAGVKFTVVVAGVSALLLLSYEFLVRYTWMGALLNGRRRRPSPAA